MSSEKFRVRKRRRRDRTVGFEAAHTRPEIYFRVALAWLALLVVVMAVWFFWPDAMHQVVIQPE